MQSKLSSVFASDVLAGTLHPRLELSRDVRFWLSTHPHNNTNRRLTHIQILLRAHKEVDPHTHRNDLNYFAVPNGALIIPDDCTYTRFISNDWYPDEDIEGL